MNRVVLFSYCKAIVLMYRRFLATTEQIKFCWHNGSAFVFCSCGCTFESEPSPTSAHACGEVTGYVPAAKRSASVAPRGESWGMYITFASAKIANKAEPTLALNPRGDVTKYLKQVPVAPKKDMCPPKKKKVFKKCADRWRHWVVILICHLVQC